MQTANFDGDCQILYILPQLLFRIDVYYYSNILGGGSVEEYKKVNAQESQDLADAFLSYKFLDVSLLWF